MFYGYIFYFFIYLFIFKVVQIPCHEEEGKN